MPKTSKALRIAINHARTLPRYPNEGAAKKAFFALIAARSDRLRKLAAAGQGPPCELSADGLRALELWATALSPEALNRLRCDQAELDLLLHWHMASVAVERVSYTRWVVEPSPFARGRWQLGIRCGLMSRLLHLKAAATEPPRGKRASATPHSDELEWFEDRASGDPTLNPVVLANESKLSSENSLRTCQTFTLIRGIDAFSERALVAALPNSADLKRLEVIRCFEPLRRLSDRAIRALSRAARAKEDGSAFAIALVIRHRPSTGLKLAAELRDRLCEYSYGPVVKAIVSIRDLTATDILADAVRKISARKHPLWQERRTYAMALARLWHLARAGDGQAQEALVVAGRRWKRIPPETRAMIRRRAPGLTAEVAKAGGVVGARR